MTVTAAQRDLLRRLEDGYEITFRGGHYVTERGGKISEAKLWPTTFYGLYDKRYIQRLDNGNYTISEDGKKQIRGPGR